MRSLLLLCTSAPQHMLQSCKYSSLVHSDFWQASNSSLKATQQLQLHSYRLQGSCCEVLQAPAPVMSATLHEVG